MPCAHSLSWHRWCNGLGNVVFWHTFGLVNTNQSTPELTAYLKIVADHVHSFITTIVLTHLLMATSSMIMYHVTKQKPSQTGFTNVTMSSVFFGGRPSLLGCGTAGDSQLECAPGKILDGRGMGFARSSGKKTGAGVQERRRSGAMASGESAKLLDRRRNVPEKTAGLSRRVIGGALCCGGGMSGHHHQHPPSLAGSS